MSNKSGHHTHGKRGRHKKQRSQETRVWEEEHLFPECPHWMSKDTYRKLVELRGKV